MSEEKLYCKVFVNAPVEHETLRSWIAQRIDGRKRLFDTVESPVLTLDVIRNEEAEAREADDPDAFLYYRYYLDAEPALGTDRADYVQGVGALLEALWAERWPAVAASDFEDELPFSGGYHGGGLTIPKR